MYEKVQVKVILYAMEWTETCFYKTTSKTALRRKLFTRV